MHRPPGKGLSQSGVGGQWLGDVLTGLRSGIDPLQPAPPALKTPYASQVHWSGPTTRLTRLRAVQSPHGSTVSFCKLQKDAALQPIRSVGDLVEWSRGRFRPYPGFTAPGLLGARPTAAHYQSWADSAGDVEGLSADEDPELEQQERQEI